jgi:hypothetical protein
MDIKDLKEDFINLTKTKAISAEGNLFVIGDVVNHEDEKAPKNGKIAGFTINEDTYDVIAHTQHGEARISFLHHSKY